MNRSLPNKYVIASVVSLALIGSIFLGFNIKNLPHRSLIDAAQSDVYERTTNSKNNPDEKLQELKIYDIWSHFTVEDGLPSNKINTVRVDGDQLWVGTDKGLALMESGKVVKVYKEEDGLAHHNAVSVDVHPMTGDVWIGTMSGLNRFSAGKFETFNQFNSGLAKRCDLSGILYR